MCGYVCVCQAKSSGWETLLINNHSVSRNKLAEHFESWGFNLCWCVHLPQMKVVFFLISWSTRLSPMARQSAGRASVPTIHPRKQPLLSLVSGPQCMNYQLCLEPVQPNSAECVVLILWSKVTHSWEKLWSKKCCSFHFSSAQNLHTPTFLVSNFYLRFLFETHSNSLKKWMPSIFSKGLCFCLSIFCL